MAQIEYIGTGSLARVADILAETGAKKIFLAAGKNSYAASGAQAQLNTYLGEFDVLRYDGFSALPLQEDIDTGLAAYRAFGPDLVIAVGGGHVLDCAKAINALGGQKPLIAIPTTAGSGSEATPFAVIYKDGVKTSMEGPHLLPSYAIVDPALAASAPQSVALASGLDALCQAIESYWSRKATDESRGYARQALEHIWPHIAPALLDREPGAREHMSIGAHLAGKAIAISKTTGCHALSYGLTYRFGVPHGIAVAACMPHMYRLNGESPSPRITELNIMLGASDSAAAAAMLEAMFARLGVGKLRDFGVQEEDIGSLAQEVNAERLANNPRDLSKADIINAYKAIW